MAQEPIRIEISYKTILFLFAIIFAVWLFVQIRAVLVLLFVSLILVSAFHSPVDFLQKRKIPRALAILILYLIVGGLLGGAISLIIPPFVEQTRNLVERFPAILAEIARLITFYQIPTQDLMARLAQEFGFFGTNFLKLTVGFLSSILGLITLIVFTFYLLLEWPRVVSLASSLFSGKEEKKIKTLLNDVESGLGAWVRGQVALMIIVGLLSYIGLTLLQVPYALSLAVLAGLLEIVAIIGPILAAVPAILTALLISPVLALAVAALYFIIQQLENHLIVPNVMRKAVGVNPLVTILALMIGAKLAGIAGAVLSVPLVVLIKIVLRNLLQPEGEEVTEE
jgi:predicted PurR-regulated permease PerM